MPGNPELLVVEYDADAATTGSRPAARFTDLIAPLTPREFFSDYWEKTYFIQHHQPEIYAGFFSRDDVPRWMNWVNNGSVFVLIPAGPNIRYGIYDPNSLGAEALRKNYDDGLTQILKGLAGWPSFRSLARNLGALFQGDVYVNAFLTPAGAKTHPVYLANDDIFVLQLEGEETWQLQEMSLLQLELSQRKNLEFPNPWRNRDKTPVRAELYLRPGDLLYVPRGMPHWVASPQSAALSLRFYIKPLFWADLFKIAIEDASLFSPHLRRALPQGFVQDSTLDESMHTTFQQIMEKFREVRFERVLAAARRNRVAFPTWPALDQADLTPPMDKLGDQDEVERMPDLLCTVEEIRNDQDRPRAAIFFGDRQVNGPPHLRPAMAFVRDHHHFRICELPGLPPGAQKVLIRRLIADGLLRLCPATG